MKPAGTLPLLAPPVPPPTPTNAQRAEHDGDAEPAGDERWRPAIPSSPSSSTSGTSSPVPAPAAPGGSIYDSLKNGISTAIDDVGDAIAGGAHAVVSGVETALSTANHVATGIVELPFAAVAKASGRRRRAHRQAVKPSSSVRTFDSRCSNVKIRKAP